jgi:hypothetical protein
MPWWAWLLIGVVILIRIINVLKPMWIKAPVPGHGPPFLRGRPPRLAPREETGRPAVGRSRVVDGTDG